uniref:uncharacterized protein n=1 Tax=Semicossyphus pulcher TaxID=241346 RepID=UPI0037E88DA6
MGEEGRREVGCQWECPEEEERKEVGCQSDSAERRDAAVQVDLLTQQLSWRHTGVCGVVWQCVSVRADEPGGGALLQHCSTHSRHAHFSPHLRNPQLPTMPLCGPPAPPDHQEHQSKDHQQTALLPSIPLCELPPLLPPADASAAPPPGLIAPLSPRLAEEEEEEEEEEGGSLKHDNSESFPGYRQYTITAEKKKCQRSECSTRGVQSRSCCSTHSSRQRSRRRCNGGRSQPDVTQLKERRKIRIQTQHVETRQHCRRRRIQTGRPEARIKRTQAEGGEDKTPVEEEEGVRGKIRPELSERPRRKALHLSVPRPGHHLSRTSALCLRRHYHHSTRGSRHGNMATPPDTHATDNRPKEEVNTMDEGKKEEIKERGNVKGDRTLLPAPTEAPDWTRRRERVLKTPHWWVDYLTTKRRRKDAKGRRKRQENNGGRGKKRRRCRDKEEVKLVSLKEGEKRRRDGGGNEEDNDEVMKHPRRPRRSMVGPPIRYLLESEGQSHGPVTADQERAEGFGCVRKPQKKNNAEGGAFNVTAMIDRSEVTEHTERQTGQTDTERQTGLTNKDVANGAKHRTGRPKKVMTDCEIGGGASEKIDISKAAERQTVRERITGQTDTERQTGQTDTERHRGTGRTWRKRRRCRDEEEVKLVCLKEGERRRRDGGGNEEDNDEENQTEEVMKRPRRSMVGPPIRYLLESEGQSHGPVTANQERAEGFGCVRKPQKKSNTEGGALNVTAMIDRSEVTEHTERQTGQTDTERQTGGTDTERQTGQTDTERQTGGTDTERQTGSYRQTPLMYLDVQSSQVTVFPSCCVTLQRLL